MQVRGQITVSISLCFLYLAIASSLVFCLSALYEQVQELPFSILQPASLVLALELWWWFHRCQWHNLYRGNLLVCSNSILCSQKHFGLKLIFVKCIIRLILIDTIVQAHFTFFHCGFTLFEFGVRNMQHRFSIIINLAAPLKVIIEMKGSQCCCIDAVVQLWLFF